MAKILFAWELGGGNGHLGPFHPIARQLLVAGHTITLAVRDPDRAIRLFETLSVEVVQSPFWPKTELPKFERPINYSQLLYNIGFGELLTCKRVLTEWRAIEDRIDPAIIIADHAPGMLLAARRHRTVVAIGTGFTVPKTGVPMPPLSTGNVVGETKSEADSTFQTEFEILQVINQVRVDLQLQELRYLGEPFDTTQALFLTTFPELDHYSDRPNTDYRGGLSYDGLCNQAVHWPLGIGPRIFAYLKWSKGLGHLLDAIGQSGCPALLVTDGMNVDELQRIARPHMQFIDRPLPIDKVARECDFAILNATHGTTCSLLLAGKPILQIPHNLEQGLTANRTAAIGAAICANKDDGLAIVSAFQTMRFDTQHAIAAQAFASRYQNFSVEKAAATIAHEISQMLAQPSSLRSLKYS